MVSREKTTCAREEKKNDTIKWTGSWIVFFSGQNTTIYHGLVVLIV